jgi:hypothetical protein
MALIRSVTILPAGSTNCLIVARSQGRYELAAILERADAPFETRYVHDRRDALTAAHEVAVELGVNEIFEIG